MVIDTHQHYWQLNRFDYGWLTPDNSVLYRDYEPDDLWPDMHAAGVDAGVMVQAHNSVDEARWALALADCYPHLAGVVGWVDLAAPDAPSVLAELDQHPRFKGVRLNLPAEGGALDRGLDALATLDLSCDLLLSPDRIGIATDLARGHSGTRFVLNHFGGFRLTPNGQAEWRQRMLALAELPNVALKLSGYLTAAVPRPLQAETLQAYVASAIGLFGASRLMYGSDWPVCLQAGRYADGLNLLRAATSTFCVAEQEAIWGETAARVYRLTNT